ncbi:MAG TPA: AMP-binding protein [Acidimicrobiales bacterium]|nr:AMP-binding protein [Acidimicrobiales bacterium]
MAEYDTIARALRARADDDHVGLLFEDRSWTWREVVAESTKRAGTMQPGQHIGVLLENVPEYVFLLFGAALAGAVIVGLNPTHGAEELAGDIKHTDCSLVIDDEANRYAECALPEHVPTPVSLYCLIFTSGSTGAPKAVQMTQGRAARTAAQSAVAFGPDDVLYCAMPLFHGNALLANVFPAVLSGAAVALRRKFSATEFMADVRRYEATYFNYVGRALSYVLAQPPSPLDAQNRLKYCLGSEASPADRKEFRRRFGCFVVEGYSSSEGGVVITPYSGMPKDALGKPAEGVDVIVLDPVTGKECPRAVFDTDGRLVNAEDAVGEIVGRDGLRNFEGYYNNAEATAERGRNGWYWTGDLAYRSDDGTFFFAGRSSDWLRVDGENFAAGPVENVIARFPGVRAVVVYPVPDPRTGDQVMATIEYDGEFDAEAFDRFLSEQPDLGAKWSPRFVRVVDAIPLTATGKVDRNPLRREKWNTTDPLWWRRDPKGPFCFWDSVDPTEFGSQFERSGRGALFA